MSTVVPTIQETVTVASLWLREAREKEWPSSAAEAANLRLASAYAEAVLTMVAACMKDGTA